jgi:hypothetical protein
MLYKTTLPSLAHPWHLITLTSRSYILSQLCESKFTPLSPFPLHWLPLRSLAMRVNVVPLAALAITAAGIVSWFWSFDDANDPSQVLSLPRHELARRSTPTAHLPLNGNPSSKKCLSWADFWSFIRATTDQRMWSGLILILLPSSWSIKMSTPRQQRL